MIDTSAYLRGIEADSFDVAEYLRSIDPAHIELFLQDSECRRQLTRFDPLLFAILYFGKSVTDDDGVMSFAEMHFELCRLALTWTQRHEPMDNRHAALAPRHAGKSSWLFKILPLWALAHGHVKFMAAFTSNGTQAQIWFTNVKRELDGNQLLRMDYPDLCTPAVRETTGRAVMDNQHAYSSRGGSALYATGIDSNSLGLNIDDRRPDLIIFDDIEPDESNYSPYQKQQRLITVIDTCLGMNLRANVLFVGTVVMLGSIFHDFVVRNDGEQSDDTKWIEDQRIHIHHFEPFTEVKTSVGVERRSMWPHKWTAKFLESIEHTAMFAKNFLNRPIGMDGEYWTLKDFRYGRLTELGHVPALKVLSIDPAVKDKKTNDYTAMSVLQYAPDAMSKSGQRGMFEVMEAYEFRLTPGEPFVQRVRGILAVHPDIFAIIVETNQGGMLWAHLLRDLPCQIWDVTHSDHKWVRAAKGLSFYHDERVLHRRKLPKLERQMMAYPKVLHDDLLDSVDQALLEVEKRYSTSNRSRSYDY
jgi:phage terminase large subunit-like protein